MKILLIQNEGFLFTGGKTSNWNHRLLEKLADRGHQCRLMAPDYKNNTPGGTLNVENSRDEKKKIFSYNNITTTILQPGADLFEETREQINTFKPDWIFVSEDQTNILEVVMELCPGKIIYISHSSSGLPFGNRSFSPNITKTGYFKKARAVITVSSYLKGYINKWTGIDATVMPIPIDTPDYPVYNNFNEGYITVINPSGIMGISILLDLARSFKSLPFGALPGWTTTSEDIEALKQMPNIHIFDQEETYETIFEKTRCLLVPSLTDEAFSQASIEAMLRGIPVIASDSGGLPEDHLDSDHIIPVRKAEYISGFDEKAVRRAIIPRQDILPWKEALEALIGSQEHYEKIAGQSREKSLSYVNSISIEPFENLLLDLNTQNSM